jgi:hypothetical protein
MLELRERLERNEGLRELTLNRPLHDAAVARDQSS